MPKLSFVIHERWNKFISKLNKEDAGEIIIAMCLYQQGEEYSFDNPVMEAYFNSILDDLEKDQKSYRSKCEKAKKAVETRWANKHAIHDDTDVSPSISEYDNDNDNVNNLTVIKDNNISPTTQINNIHTSTTTSVNCRQTCREVVDQYNTICKSLPKAKALSSAREKAIKARLKSFTKEDIVHAFSLAESSRFLCGSNDKNWKADLDWIIGTKSGGDQHLTKILEGAYIDRMTLNQRPRADNFHNFTQRTDDLDALVNGRMYGKKEVDTARSGT